MGREVDELATARPRRPGPVGHRDAVRHPPRPLTSGALHTSRRHLRTHASSTSLTTRDRRHCRLDAGRRAVRGESAIGSGYS